ncbi:anthranilate synthase component II [Clostridium kluyveri]|uniref:Aminodeoxychorismate/anthranilate synthase component II n=1 Tax=Clostridium kluyveri TaxID=1534 RepID=A0A1L5F6P9_CLOKL|nr:aminodeoxychorismate/anthranilate synthase component II [Clostridium kluyveri]APM38653.1 aminodeoxychorismate/anthranilate synthase component II [Clostridium kluyveri]UZQ50968.1 aminodeoxychorismate/anthranilate synthase component II [Clostridium kluyveri]
MILMIDNYDSFTYNLYQYIGELYEDIVVVRNDEVSVEDIEKFKNLQGIVISPGPGVPEDSGICIEVIKKYGKDIPILGICLGHQAIAVAYGGDVVRAKEIRHGKTSMVEHVENELFKGIKSPIRAMRYHSLIVDEESIIPTHIIKIAESDDGVLMGIKHSVYPVYGLQFHPESILTECGRGIIKNFLQEVCHVK